MSITPVPPLRVVAVRHVHFEDLGTFEEVLRSRGAEIQYLDAGLDDLSAITPDGPDLLVILGGPIGAYEEDRYPWLGNLKAVLAKRIARDLPTLGICLGAQLIAASAGAKVYPGGKRELGWGTISITQEGMNSPLKYLREAACHVLHWHGDTFDLPEGARLLASSHVYPHQAFSIGPNVLGVQFHPEVKAHGFDRWLIGHAVEIGMTPEQNVADLRRGTAGYATTLAIQASRMFNDWLDGLKSLPTPH
ncbi:glutamine amidotransferase [Paraburkholderia sp. J8-2]|uniref:glutamine amidotransferase n=1 Tax=Paraburkholderia sp. J8-2 TaxID=2805440 RepID=UPI002AB70A26|nr:glutamine amidotransferase [Paraburkholderia sp. J8-2]